VKHTGAFTLKQGGLAETNHSLADGPGQYARLRTTK